MKTAIKTKDMVISALLIAIGILIPMIFTGPPFRIVVGPYSATLMAHVPVIIAMFISPITAIFTAIGTAIGFFFTAPLVVAVRAASHIVFAVMGSWLIKCNMKAIPVCFLTGLVHALFEAIVVLVFFAIGASTPQEGYSVISMTLITAIGTFIHHIVDFIIAYIVAKALSRAKFMANLPKLI